MSGGIYGLKHPIVLEDSQGFRITSLCNSVLAQIVTGSPALTMGKKKGSLGRAVRVPFRCLLTTASVTSVQFNLDPTLSLRLNTIQDGWLQFRYTRLRVTMEATSTGANLAACYVPNGEVTKPTTIATVMEVIPSCIVTKENTVSRSFVVPRSVLRGQLNWYDANGGTSIASSQGIICLAADVAAIMQVVVDGVCEFQGAAAPANTPRIEALEAALHAERQLAIRERRRLALLDQLGALSPASGQVASAQLPSYVPRADGVLGALSPVSQTR